MQKTQNQKPGPSLVVASRVEDLPRAFMASCNSTMLPDMTYHLKFCKEELYSRYKFGYRLYSSFRRYRKYSIYVLCTYSLMWKKRYNWKSTSIIISFILKFKKVYTIEMLKSIFQIVFPILQSTGTVMPLLMPLLNTNYILYCCGLWVQKKLD